VTPPLPPDSRVLVGTSGWVYKHWQGVFYPAGLLEKRWLWYYSQRFSTAEVNYSFYRLPSESTFTRWAETVPPDFAFAVKGSRYITHQLKLRGAGQPVATFVARARLLGSHFGPILWQLPPTLRPDVGALREFIGVLPADAAHVFEFRRQEWYADEVIEALESGRCHLCLHDWNGVSPPRLVLGNLGYVRLHGGKTDPGGKYSRRELEDWAAWIRLISSDAGAKSRVYVYFNNDAYGNAVADAALLERLVSTAARPGSEGS